MKIVIVALIVALLFGCSEKTQKETRVGIILSDVYISKKVLDMDGKILFDYTSPMKNDTVWVDWTFGDTAITETIRKLSSTKSYTKRVRVLIVDGCKI